jgi:hypothetical protein
MENNEVDDHNQTPLEVDPGDLSDASWCSDTTARSRDSMSPVTETSSGTSSETSEDPSDEIEEPEEVYSLQDLYIPIVAKVSNSVFPDPNRYPRVYHQDSSLVMVQGPPGCLDKLNRITNLLEPSRFLQELMSTEFSEHADFFSYDNGAVDRDVPVRPPPVFDPYARLNRGHRYIFSDEGTNTFQSDDIHGE